MLVQRMSYDNFTVTIPVYMVSGVNLCTCCAHAIHNVTRQAKGHKLWGVQEAPLLKGYSQVYVDHLHMMCRLLTHYISLGVNLPCVAQSVPNVGGASSCCHLARPLLDSSLHIIDVLGSISMADIISAMSSLATELLEVQLESACRGYAISQYVSAVDVQELLTSFAESNSRLAVAMQ